MKLCLLILLFQLINNSLVAQVKYVDILKSLSHSEQKMGSSDVIKLSDSNLNLLNLNHNFVCEDDTFFVLKNSHEYTLFCSSKIDDTEYFTNDGGSYFISPRYQYLLIDKINKRCLLSKYLYPLMDIKKDGFIGGIQEVIEGKLYYFGELDVQYPYSTKLDIEIDFSTGDFMNLSIYDDSKNEKNTKSIDFASNKKCHFNIFNISYHNLLGLYTQFDEIFENCRPDK